MRLPVGAMYFAPWLLARQSGLSRQYLRDWMGKRAPIVLCLPGAGLHCLDREWYPYAAGHEEDDVHDGWTITGEAPLLTASPSLGIGQRPEGGWLYHGWLKAGVLSDDLDGRTYPPRVD